MKENGFTLIETLIVLSIGALLLTGIGNAIASFSPALDRVKERAIKTQSIIELQSLEEILQIARFVDSEGKVFEQKLNELTFMSRLPIAVGRKGYVTHRLAKLNESGNNIMRLDVVDNNITLPPVTILNNIQQITFPKQSDLAPDDQGNIGPQKITIITNDGSKLELPINPITSETKTCIFDPISQACRQ